jgi:acyl-CoA synthetase (AMP-forming)/AMP-acid ligase II
MNANSPAQWVFEHANRTPCASAVDAPDVRLSYAELAQRMGDLVASLDERGVTPRDRVVVAVPASPAAAVATLAVHSLGASVVEIDSAWGADALGQIIAQTGARHVIAAGRDAARWRTAVPEGTFHWAWLLDTGASSIGFPSRGTTTLLADGSLPDEERPRDRHVPADVDGDAEALILYTSGSTGAPRGVIQTYRNIAANTRSIVQYLQLDRTDRVMAILPFHYCYGRSLLQTHLYVGGSVFVDPRFAFRRMVVEGIGKEGCTGFAGVPVTFEILRNEVDVRAVAMPRLRYVTQAGGPMRPETAAWVREVFAPARLFIMYGQTEATARLAYLPPERGEEKRGSIGIPIPGVELKVVAEDGRELSSGEAGHLVARGENVTPGYVGAAAETAAILKDGWLWTGDLATRDDEGFFFLVGRAKDMLKIGGYRISPVELEQVIALHPAVEEAAVLGEEDPFLGQVAVAYVVARTGMQATEREVRRFCRERLPLYKVPSRVVFVDEIPKNSSGKPLKSALRERSAAVVERPAGGGE